MQNKTMISRKYFFIGAFIASALLFSFLVTLSDGKLHIIFCNVGQGDASYIRTPGNQDILVDGGPNDKVLACLGKYMPFYDRTIDIVVLSHPQKDHMEGLLSVIERYTVKYFVIGAEENKSEGYEKLVSLLKKNKIPVRNLYSGEKIYLGDTSLDFLWPQKEWVTQNLKGMSEVASANSNVLGLETGRDVNDFSYYIHLSYGSFGALFTGDGDVKIQPEILERIDLPDIDVLKYPHHGSKYGALSQFLEKVKPELAVISVGKNPWGHPNDETINMLNSMKIQIKRTDRDGDIELVSDGENYWIK